MPSSILGNDAYAPPQPDRPRAIMTTPAHAPQAIRNADATLPENPTAAPKLDKRSREYILKSGLAGGIAGCAAKTIVGPLDRVKILFQASNPQFAKYTGSWFGVATAIKDIWAQDGSRGLFRGHSATLLRIFPYAGIKFLAYEQIRAVIIKDKSQETSLRRLTSGSLAGLVSVFFTYPLEVIRVRLAFETKRGSRSSLTGICKKIYNERAPIGKASAPHINTSSAYQIASTTTNATATSLQQVTPRSGLSNFYRGFTPTMWGMFPYAGFSFLTHDAMGDLMRHPRLARYTTLPNTRGKSRDPEKPAQLKHWAELTTGGVAGFVSQTLSYPLEVIRRRMQVGGVVGDGHRLTMTEVARKIHMERGWRGFFVGLAIGYVKVVPMVATSFFVYERAKYYLGI
ncbi:hypothetical protein W97_06662 [Coniosporium apollinis CBS 100218]|uniref:Mitochondrial thiamine pyrophosphate carrier 1 n=1 Tax=Coniosporium apollinis (strain CBS 100218) TaxID=1168221 RepID=R7Z039_CONA1|nr:uncharacterized protein W97_06662 [Coniosporium apollinis CBS 100218]EON67409.1 hypothetical protein W97_06662 [Coniosporium apollinis CBS 100218]